MATPTDLWGALDARELIERTPLSILREQAVLLGQKTGNLVEARVETKPSYGGRFKLTLKLVVPGLDNYTYELLALDHPVTLYPVIVVRDGIELLDEAAFVDWLRIKLSSPDTHRIVGHLLSQASS